MDTRDNKTPEEELQHFKEVSQPEDFDHPEPDIVGAVMAAHRDRRHYGLAQPRQQHPGCL